MMGKCIDGAVAYWSANYDWDWYRPGSLPFNHQMYANLFLVLLNRKDWS